MKDPFIFPPIPWLQRAAQPVADYLFFPTLPLHVHEIVAGALLYSVIYYPVSPILSTLLFPRHYPQLSRKRRLNWDAHVVSLVQSCLINGLALWVMVVDEERKAMTWEERIWGYTGASGMIQGLAAGYFVWDLIVTSRNLDVFGLGTLAHAISALLVFSLGFVCCSPLLFHALPRLTSSYAATVPKLLRLHLYPLGALDAVPQYPLVPRQTRHDGHFGPAV